MLKKDITFVNPFTEQQVTEEHYFHLPKAELVRMEMEEHNKKYTATKGELAGQELSGMQAHLQRMIEAEDGRAVLREFEEILRRSYGKKDGDRFVRSETIWEGFKSSEAYSEFLFQLFTQPDEMAKFIAAVFPGDLEEIVREVAARTGASAVDSVIPSSDGSVWTITRKPVLDAATPENPVDITRVDMIEMDAAYLQGGLADGRFKFALSE